MIAALPDFLPPALVREASNVHLARGENLFRLGEPVAHVYFVLAGEVLAARYLRDGSEAVMQRGMGGEFFAQSALMASHYGCDARAATPASVMRFPVEVLRATLAAGGSFALSFANQLATDLRRQCTRVERFHIKLVRDRVLHFLACEGPVVRPGAKLQDWALELGVEPETLSRVLTEMEAAGEVVRESRGARGVRLPER